MAVVGAMEDVLRVYEMPYDADYPQVSLDEKLATLHAEVVEPLEVQPGQAERLDYEHERLATANLLVRVERLAGIVMSRAPTAARLPTMPVNGSGWRMSVIPMPRKSQYPSLGELVSGLSARRGLPADPSLRAALHAQTRLVAQHDRV
ncbi:MAG: hypothetical protein ABI947_21420 [Chloroflexota bacterium]